MYAMDLAYGVIFRWQDSVFRVVSDTPDDNGNIRVNVIATLNDDLSCNRYDVVNHAVEKFNGYAQDIQLGTLQTRWVPSEEPTPSS